MRVAVFSDIHGNYQALEAIMKHIENNNIDKIIYLGDAVSIGPDSNLCLKYLNQKTDHFILGNHEHYIIDGNQIDKDMSIGEVNHNKWLINTLDKQDINKLREYTNSYELIINNKKFLFIHFFLKDDIYPYEHLSIYNNNFEKIVNNVNSDYVFYGHYHPGRYDKINNKELYCIGSSGCVHSDETFYYVIDGNEEININKITLKYDRKSFINRVNSIDYPERNKIKKSFFGIY